MSHPSTLLLHQFRLGELDHPAEDGIRSHLADCTACAARIDHQRALRAEFVRMPMPSTLEPKPAFWERWRIGFVALAIAAALLIAVAPGTAPDTRSKGSASTIEAWIETGASARPVYTNEVLRSGTRLQLKFDAHGHRFVTLAGRDGLGTVEVYSTLPAHGGIQTAPFALTLDDTPGEQTFYAILSDTRPSSDALMEALAQDPVQVQRAEVHTLVLRKE